jgi:hypothetical protein
MQTASNQASIVDKTPSDVIDKRNHWCEPLDQQFDIYTKEPFIGNPSFRVGGIHDEIGE